MTKFNLMLRKMFNIVFLAFILLIFVFNIMHTFETDNAHIPVMLAVFAVFALIYFFVWKVREINARQFWITVAITVFMGSALRLAAAIFIPCEPISDYKTIYDAGVWASQGDFSSYFAGGYFHRFPHITFFSLSIGFFCKIFSAGTMTIKLMNIFFKAAAIIGAACVGREIAGNKCGIFAALLLALFPADIFYSVVLAAENFALAFFVFSVYFMLRAYNCTTKKGVYLNAFYSSLLLTLGSLFRGVAPFYLAAYSISIAIIFMKKTRIISILITLCTYFILFQIVSSLLFHSGITEFEISKPDVPYSIYILEGFNFETVGKYSEKDHEIYFEANGDKELINKMVTQRLSQRFCQNPEKIVPLLFKKTQTIWTDGTFGSVYWAYENNGTGGEKPLESLFSTICSSYFIALLVLVMLGIIYSKDKNMLCFLALLILGFEGALMLIEIQPRYTYAVAYVLILIATSSISRPQIAENN